METDKVKPQRYILSALTRRASDQHNRLELLSATVVELLNDTAPPKTPYDLIDLILVAVHERTETPLGHVRIPYDDYPLFFARGAEELGEFLDLLKNLRLVESSLQRDDKSFRARLTLEGWDRIAELRKTGGSSSRAFVAMSFAPGLDPAYDDAIVPALTDAGWTPVRMDRTHHNERIDDKIVAEIKRAGMLVADFTGNRPGVYFEAGLAVGLDIPVIWTVRKSDLGEVHFDTRQYNHIIWTEAADLREKLHDRVVATVRPPVV